MLTLIVARAPKGAIGKNGEIPWNIPEDLAVFQRETLGGALIMGRHTWNSLPFRPLKGRLNCVVSRDPGLTDNVCSNLDDALSLCRSQGYHRIYGIGGNAIYSGLLPLADRLLITEVDVHIPDADAFFPEFDKATWAEINQQKLKTQSHTCVVREFIRPR
jgi:dihydrofolate reductase